MRPTCRHPKGCATAVEAADLCSKHYRVRLRTGENGYVDATPVAERLRTLSDCGWSLSEVERRTGLGHTGLSRIVRGDFRRVRARTARLVLALEPQHLDSRRSVDATGTRRRVEALARMGWTARSVSEAVGLRPSTLSQMFWRGTVSLAIANRVARFYDKASGTFGGNHSFALKAVTLGYAPPGAWDDDTVDDPQARPNLTGYDEDTVRALMRGDVVESRQVDRREAVARLAEQDMPVKAIAERLRVANSTARQYRREAA